MAHTDLISVTRFRFQMQGFSRSRASKKICMQNLQCPEFLLTGSQIILFVFLEDV